MRKPFFKISLLSLLALGVSCSDEPLTEELPQDQIEVIQSSNKDLKIAFAKALSLSMNQSKELRDFLKEESLKMFDNDYDVLYHNVKSHQLSDGTTIRDLILSNYENEAELTSIESEIPLLTIFVPILPEDSFSAELWDTENEIPHVAIRLNDSNNVPVINNEGENYVLEGGQIPAFPIVVIKENERIIYNAGVKSNNSAAKGKSFTSKECF